MRDFNFFSEYVYVKSTFKLKKLILPLFYVVLLVALGGAFYYMESKISQLEDAIETNKQIIESVEYTNVLSEASVLREEITTLETISMDLENFKLSLPFKYRVTDELMKMVIKSIPRNVSFNNYSITPDGITISAVSSDYAYIAELEYNLRSLNIFSSVFIRVISEDELDGFIFDVDLAFGGDNIE